MQITIRYTLGGTAYDNVIECSDSETYPNGQPVPVGASAEWASIVENVDKISCFEVVP